MSVVIATDRLELRHLTEADAPQLRALNDNPNVYRYTGDGPLADDAAALQVLRTRVFPQYRAHGVGRWAVVRKSDGAFLGWCGLRWDADDDSYDLGYRFFEEHWGKGYATESAAAVLAWGRRALPGGRIVARARVENTASRRVLEKIGMGAFGQGQDLDGVVDLFRLGAR